MNYAQKRECVDALKKDFDASGLVVITSQSGLTVEETSVLRSKMREAGARFKVIKNTLARLAVEGSRLEPVASYFQGPTAVAFSEDSVAAARVVVGYAESNPKLTVIAGVLGDKILNKGEVLALAKLPSLEVLRAKIVGVIQAPASKVVSVINEPGRALTCVLSAYSSH